MQYGDPDLEWTGWLADNQDRDEATKLAALREYIFAAAEQAVDNGGISAEWADKKLAAVGIARRTATDLVYEIEVPVNVPKARLTVYAPNRAAALDQFHTRLLSGRYVFNDVEAATDPTFISGPEDGPLAIDPDAPTTVDGTLVKLREIILLGHVAGPKYCRDGANDALAEFGLGPVPPIKEFLLIRPAFATFTTKVNAYDVASAVKVAEWRWDNGRTAYEVTDATPDGPISVASQVDDPS